jgi:SAM-dependent methyltransferase
VGDKQPSMIDLVIEAHKDLERQGPGSPEMTIKALSFLENIDKINRIADLGCGNGGQTMVLAQNLAGSIVGVDLFPDFIHILNENAKRLNLEEKINGLVGSMDDLPFQKEEFDLIWSEGAIDNIGFEKGLRYWNTFLKKGGYVAVTSPSWFADAHPLEVDKFWLDAGSKLDTIGHNIEVMQAAGYQFIASFMLPEKCWTDHYFVPRDAALKALLEKYSGNKTVEAFAMGNQREVELYSKYKQYYGYAFYIGKKL